MRELAIKHRLRYCKAEDGTYVVPGRRGFICSWGDGRLAWVLTYNYHVVQPTARLKEMAKGDPLLQLTLEGDEEAVFLFDPVDLPYVARRWCRSKFRRKARPCDLENLRSVRSEARLG